MTKRFGDNPQLKALKGTEIIPAQAPNGGTDTSGAEVAAGDDISIKLLDLMGLRVNTVTIAGGVATVDCGYGMVRNHVLTLTGNATLVLSNLASAGYATEGEIRITQDGTGSRTLTLPAHSKALGGSDTAVASAAGRVTVLSFKTVNDGESVEYAMQECA